MTSTKEVLDHHLACLGRADLEGVISDYSPDAVVFTPDGPLTTPDAIRAFFEWACTDFGKPGATFNMKQASVVGDFAYIVWTAETADNVYEFGTDTFVIRDGKILAQSFAGTISPKAEAHSTRKIPADRHEAAR